MNRAIINIKKAVVKMLKQIIIILLLAIPMTVSAGDWHNIKGIEGDFYVETKIIDNEFYKFAFYFDKDSKIKKVYDCTSNKNKLFQKLCDLNTQQS